MIRTARFFMAILLLAFMAFPVLGAQQAGADKGAREKQTATPPGAKANSDGAGQLPAVVLEGLTASTVPLAVREKPSKKYGT